MRYLLLFFMAFSCFVFARQKQSPPADDKSNPVQKQKAANVNALPLFPMKYLDEIGHLNSDEDKRKSLDFGFAKLFAASNGDLRFEGRDDKGKPWHVWLLPMCGLIGFIKPQA
jgi:hypothetical protein